MERFTFRDSDGTASIFLDESSEWTIGRNANRQYTITGDAIERLAAYEDTGMEPEDIISSADMAKIACALHELNAYKDLGSIAHLRDLLRAEQDGRLKVFPCKAGDTVYTRNHHGRIVDGVVESIHQNCVGGKPGRWVVTVYYPEYNGSAESGLNPDFLPMNMYHGLDDFGRTVYLTREEAALEGGTDHA